MKRRSPRAFRGSGYLLAETPNGGVIVRLEFALQHKAGEKPRRVSVLANPEVTDAELVAELRTLARMIERNSDG
jgi:hypothetical protein